jgi:outer membrane protein TolC
MKCFYPLRFLSAFLFFHLGAVYADNLSLDSFIQIVKEKNQSYLASKESLEHLEKKLEMNDLELSPFLMADMGMQDDRTVKMLPSFMGTRTKTDLAASLGFAKKFSTGTSVQLKQEYRDYTVFGMAALPDNPPHREPILSLALSQDLWKNILGRGTFLRRAREKLQNAGEIKAEEYKMKNLLSEAETQYWNWLFKTEEVKTRKLSLDRAKRIRSWFGKRKESGLSNSTDVLQSEALVLSREISLKNSESELKAIEAEIKNTLGQDSDLENKPVDDFEKPRPRDFLQAQEQNNPEKIREYYRPDYALSLIEAKARRMAEEEIADNLAASLTLEAKLSSQSMNADAGASFSQMASFDYPTWGVGLRWSLNLDRSALSRIREQARAESVAAEMRARQMGLSSQTAATEIIRAHRELVERVEQVSRLKGIQQNKLKSEEDRFRNGRSTTFQVVQFEQDAADAELLYLQLAIEARKLESKTQIFFKGL